MRHYRKILMIAACFIMAKASYAEEIKPEMNSMIQETKKTDTRLTLELQGVNILDVLKTLSKNSGLNIVAGKNVQGQVSIFLRDVPVREALRTILQSQGLASVEDEGIIKVMTEEEYAKKYGRPYEDSRTTQTFHLQFASADLIAAKLGELKTPYGKIIVENRTNALTLVEIPEVMESMQKLIEESDRPQTTATFRLNYIKAEDLEPKLKTFREGSSGKFEIDKRSNCVIVTDIESRVEQVRAIIEAFDVKTPQVLIEAKVVEVRLSDAYRKGINWQEIIQQVGNFRTVTALAPLTVGAPTGAAGLATLALGEGADGLQTLLQLLERVGKTNLLSSPRLMVMNNEEAKLAVATREPFVSQTVVQTVNSTNTADNVQFVDVGVTLKVLPKISHDNFVEMKIKPEVSSSDRNLELQGVAQGSDTAFTRTSIPIVTTQELDTTVQVQSGRTLVIGGLIQDQQSKSSSRLPLLGRIPFLGRAFESKSNDFSKTELVIFLTPTIVKASEDNSKEQMRFVTPKGSIQSFDAFGTYPTDIKYDTLIERRRPYWENPWPPEDLNADKDSEKEAKQMQKGTAPQGDSGRE